MVIRIEKGNMKRSILILIFLLSSAQLSPSPLIKEIKSLKPKRMDQIGIQKRHYPLLKEESELEELEVAFEPKDLPAPISRSSFPFSNPAGCSPAVPTDLSPEMRLEVVKDQIAGDFNLEERSINYIWNGPLGSFVDITRNPNVYEFEMDEYQPPFTYLADQIVTVFLQNGFAPWLRSYRGHFHLLAVSLDPDWQQGIWESYLGSYWQQDVLPEDPFIVPVSRKLPCRWMIAEGYITEELLKENFQLDWDIPDYLSAGREYLADTCSEAYRVSQEEIGYWDATSMCGPLTWQITHDAKGFPYRIGNYDSDSDLFVQANPRYWGRRPWTGFDPETYDLIQVKEPLAGYEFAFLGELNPGDILFSYGSPDKWAQGKGRFSHIFLVAGIDEKDSRLSVTNLVKNHRGAEDCSISEVVLYTPNDQETGVIHYEWNDHGYGQTGEYGFDVFRWKWITHHLDGENRDYIVRWGDTVETIAFDWKISPANIIEANDFSSDIQLNPSQRITLPPPATIKRGAE
jgi:hypothetical protein